MKILQQKIVIALLFLYGSVNIFMPKITIIAGVNFYLFEVLVIPLAYYAYLSSLKFHFNFERFYFAYFVICILTFFYGAFLFQIIDVKSLINLFRFSGYFLIFNLLLRINSDLINEAWARKIIYWNVFFLFIVGVYVLANTFFYKPPLSDLIWLYDHKFRLIGFTGKSISLDGILSIGNTSVSMGVHAAFITLISFSLFIFEKRRKYLIFSIISFIGMSLTYSRSGLLALFFGLILLTILMIRNKYFLKFLLLFFLVLITILTFFDIFSYLGDFGIFAKLAETKNFDDTSSSIRLRYLLNAYNFIEQNPSVLIFGVGYGDYASLASIGTPHLESLFFSALFKSGIGALITLVFFFIAIFLFSFHIFKRANSSIVRGLSLGITSYMPGFFVANIVGGESLFTDFMAPFFYIILGTTYILYQKEAKVSCNESPLN